MPDAIDPDTLRREVADLEWYHTLELAPGVVTQGWFDLREVPAKLPFPPLEGKRCLDIGTFDGFWAFEMERRGAAEVIAVDVNDPAGWDWPPGSSDEAVAAIAQRKAGGAGFELAQRALGSGVRRLDLSVYDLDESVVGSFDFVYLGSLLLHLRDPVRALERARSVCTGTVLVVDAIDPFLSAAFRRRPLAGLDAVGRPWWWKPNVAGLVRMVEAAGLRPVGPPHRLLMPPGRGQERPRPSVALLRSPAGRTAAISAWRGDPHAAVLADATSPQP